MSYSALSDLEAITDKCLEILHYVRDKDVFIDYYHDHLAKRLIHYSRTSSSSSSSSSSNNSASSNNRSAIDDEKMVISRMKLQQGTQFTVKLDGLIHDYLVMDEPYKKYCETFSCDKVSYSR